MSDQRIKNQQQVEQSFIEQLNHGKYTIENPLIILNPYGINPLSAYLMFDTDEEVAITVVTKGRKRSVDIVDTYLPNTRHILPIIGLYNNSLNKVEISYYQHEPIIHEIQTENTEYLNDLVVEFEANPIIMSEKLLVYASPVTWFNYPLPIGIDMLGDIRWLLTKPVNFDIKQLENGHLMAPSGEMVLKPYYVTGLLEFDWMGKIYKFYEVETMVHHDFIEMDDRRILILTDQKTNETTEDSFIIIDKESGTVLNRWNYQDFIDPTKARRSGSGSSSDFDWFHNNAVWYDKFNNSVTLSSRHMDALINLNLETQQINWILSNPKGWDEEIVDNYFLTPKGYNFEYTYGQHAVSITKKGEVICFDNHYLGKKSEDYIEPEESFSRGVRFKINPKLKTVETVWQFGKDLGAKVFSPYISFVESFNDEHNLIHFGGTGLEDGKISKFHGPAGFEHGVDMVSQTFEIAYGQTVLHSHVKGNYFRARKLKFSNSNYSFDASDAKVITVKD